MSAGAGYAAVGQAIGNIGGTLFSAHQGRRAARKQRKFIRNMRATAYQATVKDMREAGINPMLAYMQGPTQSGQGSAALVPNMGQAVSGFAQDFAALDQASSAKGEREQKVNVGKAQKDLIDMQRSNVFADTWLKRQQAGATISNRLQIDAQTRLLTAQLPRAEAIGASDRTKAGKAGNVTSAWMQRFMNSLPPLKRR